MLNTNSTSQKLDVDSAVIAFFACILILICFFQVSEQFLHWFVIPVALCGVLIGIDAVDWFRSRLALFDPIAIIGLLGFHFFFLAPLLHVSLNFWLLEVTPPTDWRPWLGGMAALNFLGLIAYRVSRNSILPTRKLSQLIIWKLNPKRFPVFLSGALITSAVLQILVYQKFGGVLNYIQTAVDPSGLGQEAFSGMGLLFMFSESFPVLAMLGFTAYARQSKPLQTNSILLIALVSFLVLQLFFGGLRGSRSNTIWAIFWAVGMIHFWIRPISKKAIALGLAGLVLFMYIYGFFKTGGLDGLKTAFESQNARTNMEQTSGRTWKSLVLQDLGRSDIQAFLLYRMMKSDSDYEYALGRTYWAAATTMIPSAIFADKPPSKSKEGTNAQYGMGSYIPVKWESSKVYGLAGEAMLNFGPLAVPISFVALGLVVGYVRRCSSTWHPLDTRSLLLPVLVNFCFVVLVSDLDNDIYFMFKQAGFPFLVILMSSKSHHAKSIALTPQL